jgi:hypothetical protein
MTYRLGGNRCRQWQRQQAQTHSRRKEFRGGYEQESDIDGNEPDFQYDGTRVYNAKGNRQE